MRRILTSVRERRSADRIRHDDREQRQPQRDRREAGAERRERQQPVGGVFRRMRERTAGDGQSRPQAHRPGGPEDETQALLRASVGRAGIGRGTGQTGTTSLICITGTMSV